MVKNPPANAEGAIELGLVPGWRRALGEGNGNPLPGYSCLGYPMDRGAWWGTVHGATKELDITKARPKNAQTTAQLHSSHRLVK